MKDEELLKYLCDGAESSYEFVSDIMDSVEDENARRELERQKESYRGLANTARNGLRGRGVEYRGRPEKRRKIAPSYPNSVNMAVWKCENDLEELERTVNEYKKSDYDKTVAALANEVEELERENAENLRRYL